MDDIMFSQIRRPGYDIMVVWDYSSFHIDWSCTRRYNEICLFAWSIGVYAASQTVQAIDSKITLRIAANGTERPVDDRFGMPESEYYALLDNLSDASVENYFEKMTYAKEDADFFNTRRPNRSTDQIRGELQSISDRTILDTPSNMRWDIAFVGTEDRIFPRFNQLRAWQDSGVTIRQIPTGHFFNFASIIDRYVIDKGNVKRCPEEINVYSQSSGIQVDTVEHLLQLIRINRLVPAVTSSKNAVLEIGSGAGILSRPMASMVNDAQIILWDMSTAMPDALPCGRRYRFRNCDAEIEISRLSPDSIDHIFSMSAIQMFNSPERFLINCRRILRRDGYVFLSTYTAGNLHEIADITGKNLPLLTPEQWIALAERHFELIASETYTRDLDFETPREALLHLKLSGENMPGISDWTTIDSEDIERRYPMRLDGRYHLTFRPIILILHKKS